MISKERTLIEFNTTIRLLLWGEATIRLVVLFFIVLYMCCSILASNIKGVIRFVKIFFRISQIFNNKMYYQSNIWIFMQDHNLLFITEGNNYILNKCWSIFYIKYNYLIKIHEVRIGYKVKKLHSISLY